MSLKTKPRRNAGFFYVGRGSIKFVNFKGIDVSPAKGTLLPLAARIACRIVEQERDGQQTRPFFQPFEATVFALPESKFKSQLGNFFKRQQGLPAPSNWYRLAPVSLRRFELGKRLAGC